jgi:hypothetical protein
MLASLWTWPLATVVPEALPNRPPLPCHGHQACAPLCFHHPGCRNDLRPLLEHTVAPEWPWITLVQQWPIDVAWRTPLEYQCTPKSTSFQSCSSIGLNIILFTLFSNNLHVSFSIRETKVSHLHNIWQAYTWAEICMHYYCAWKPLQ